MPPSIEEPKEGDNGSGSARLKRRNKAVGRYGPVVLGLVEGMCLRLHIAHIKNVKSMYSRQQKAYFSPSGE